MMRYVLVNILAYISLKRLIRTKDTVLTFMSEEWQYSCGCCRFLGSDSVVAGSLVLLPSLCVRGVWASFYDIGICVLFSLETMSLRKKELVV